jgi:hypothetical protein
MGKKKYQPNLFLAGYYNLGTTTYYNVPYKEQPIA